MKKRTKPEQQKEKVFVATPFSSLKGVRIPESRNDSPGLQTAPVPPPPPAGDDDEATLFLRAMSGVKQLDVTTAAPVRPAQSRKPEPRRIDLDEQRVFLEALEGLKLDVTFADCPDDDAAQPRPLPVNRMRQLRRGAIRIDYELDLHGLTRDEALASLESFIAGAHRRGQKAVLVITGKGNNSPGEPVLQGAVSEWLRDRGKGVVAEFFPAPPAMGGGGAVVVFLKEKKGEELSVKG